MLTEEYRARSKQKEALKNEREKKYNKAGSLYCIAKVIWSRLSDSKSKQNFCESRRKQCEAMAIIYNNDDDDEY